MKKIILLDTRDARRLTSIDNDGKAIQSTSRVEFDLNKVQINTKSIKSIGVHTIELPNVFYNITSRNNKIAWSLASTLPTVYEAFVPFGQYTNATLQTTLKSQMESQTAGKTYNFNQNPNTFILSMTVSPSEVITFHSADSTIGNVLGWTEHQSGLEIKGQRPMDLRGITSVLIKTSGKNVEPNIYTTAPNNDLFLYQILMDKPFGQTVYHRAQTGLELFPVPKINLDGKLILELVNRNLEPVFLNNFEWRVSLIIEYLL